MRRSLLRRTSSGGRVARALSGREVTETFSVPLPTDEEGYLDRQCPSATCRFSFKIHGDDSLLFTAAEAFCPQCRKVAPVNHWPTQRQHEHAVKVVGRHVQQRLARSMRQRLRSLNRLPSGGGLGITLSVEAPTLPPIIPLSPMEPMRQRVRCEQCGCRYSFVGAAFFCPACGHNSVERTFRQSLDAMRTAARRVDSIRNSMDRDDAELLVRNLLEGSVINAVTTFQRLAERLYEGFPRAESARQNAFQSLDTGSSLWRAATGRGYEDIAPAADLALLRMCFQQRHVLVHNQGIVDDAYVKRSGDPQYQSGQHIVVRAVDVLALADAIERLASEMLDQASHAGQAVVDDSARGQDF